MADTRIVCPICTVISSRACLACQTLEPGDQGQFLGGHLLHFFFFFRLVMQKDFIQVIWNNVNDKKYTL